MISHSLYMLVSCSQTKCISSVMEKSPWIQIFLLYDLKKQNTALKRESSLYENKVVLVLMIDTVITNFGLMTLDELPCAATVGNIHSVPSSFPSVNSVPLAAQPDVLLHCYWLTFHTHSCICLQNTGPLRVLAAIVTLDDAELTAVSCFCWNLVEVSTLVQVFQDSTPWVEFFIISCPAKLKGKNASTLIHLFLILLQHVLSTHLLDVSHTCSPLFEWWAGFAAIVRVDDHLTDPPPGAVAAAVVTLTPVLPLRHLAVLSSAGMVIIRATVSHNQTVAVTIAAPGVWWPVHSGPEHKARVVLSLATVAQLRARPGRGRTHEFTEGRTRHALQASQCHKRQHDHGGGKTRVCHCHVDEVYLSIKSGE